MVRIQMGQPIDLAMRLPKHKECDDDHEQSEQEEQPSTIERLTDPRTQACADHPASRKHERTLPARARVIRLDKALSATATALVPMATCVDGTPTP